MLVKLEDLRCRVQMEAAPNKGDFWSFFLGKLLANRDFFCWALSATSSSPKPNAPNPKPRVQDLCEALMPLSWVAQLLHAESGGDARTGTEPEIERLKLDVEKLEHRNPASLSYIL